MRVYLSWFVSFVVVSGGLYLVGRRWGGDGRLLPIIFSSYPLSFAAQAAMSQMPVRQMKKPHYTISTKQLNRPQFKAAAQE